MIDIVCFMWWKWKWMYFWGLPSFLQRITDYKSIRRLESLVEDNVLVPTNNFRSFEPPKPILLCPNLAIQSSASRLCYVDFQSTGQKIAPQTSVMRIWSYSSSSEELNAIIGRVAPGTLFLLIAQRGYDKLPATNPLSLLNLALVSLGAMCRAVVRTTCQMSNKPADWLTQ